MGAATIVSNQGDGLYTIKKKISGVDGVLVLLANRRTELEKILPNLRNTLAQQWDEAQSMRQTVDAMIVDWARGGFVEYAELPTNTTTPDDADKQRILELVNQERAKNGLDPLSYNEQLATAAQNHADWMGKNTIGHDGAGGSKPADRISATGYDYSVVAENVAAGQSTPEQVFQSWMNSPGHRANILNPDIKEIGIGGGVNDDYGRTWAQNFGAPQ